jgi:hypothetical protein
MKISKERLKQIIKEELDVGETGGSYPKDPHGYEGSMVKQNLWKIAEYAKEMHDLIADDEDIEPWVEEKIAIAAYMMDSTGHHVQYQKEVGGGEGVEHGEEGGHEAAEHTGHAMAIEFGADGDEEYDVSGFGDEEDEEEQEEGY